MKQITNFRLNQESIHILSVLKQKLHLSKTEIIEQALRYYSQNKLKDKAELLKYAGSLNDEEANQILTLIQKNRYNKDKGVEL